MNQLSVVTTDENAVLISISPPKFTAAGLILLRIGATQAAQEGLNGPQTYQGGEVVLRAPETLDHPITVLHREFDLDARVRSRERTDQVGDEVLSGGDGREAPRGA